MIGSALGDAIGEIAQHKNLTNLQEICYNYPLTYTDDTAMSIGVSEFLLSGDLSTKNLGDIFLKNLNKEPWRGYGGTQNVFYVAEQTGISYEEACKKVDAAFYHGEGSYGNGSAMRIAPAALYFHNKPNFSEMIKLISKIDHSHPMAIDGAVILAWAVSYLLSNPLVNTDAMCDFLISKSETKEFKTNMQFIKEAIKNNCPAAEVDAQLGNVSRSITDASKSVPYAIYMFCARKITGLQPVI
jgi:poly(ADP-ribose) glycohydrolase ARH3